MYTWHIIPVHPGEGSASVALLKVSSLFFPREGLFGSFYWSDARFWDWDVYMRHISNLWKWAIQINWIELKSQKTSEASFRAANFLIKSKKAFADGEVLKEAMMIVKNCFLKMRRLVPMPSPFSLMSNWGQVRWLEECQLYPKTWPSNWTGIWQSAGGLASSSTSLWTARVQLSWWCLSRWCSMIFPLKKRSWHFFPWRQQRGELTSTMPWRHNAVKTFFMEKKVPLEKLVWVTREGTPAMTGRHAGFIAQCKSDPDFPKVVTLPLHHSPAGNLCKSNWLWVCDDSCR